MPSVSTLNSIGPWRPTSCKPSDHVVLQALTVLPTCLQPIMITDRTRCLRLWNCQTCFFLYFLWKWAWHDAIMFIPALLRNPSICTAHVGWLQLCKFLDQGFSRSACTFVSGLNKSLRWPPKAAIGDMSRSEMCCLQTLCTNWWPSVCHEDFHE